MPTMTNDRDFIGTGGAVLVTASGQHPLRLRRATNFISRFCGLMLRAPLAPDAGLLLTACPSVHTAFMRCAIDVVYLDAHGVVLKCVPYLRPWWGSISNAGRDGEGRRHQRAAHTLELAAGSIARLGIAAGDHLRHPLWLTASITRARAVSRLSARQRGAAIVELAVVAPVLTVMGLGTAQYSSLYFSKNQINHAAFLAARAGSVGNANIDAIKSAFLQGLIPMYGGGETPAEIAEALKSATDDASGANDEKQVAMFIEMLNPTKEAFDDFKDARLQALYKTNGKRVISNRGLGLKDDNVIGATSGQTRSDANLIKLRVLQGVRPAVKMVGSIYIAYLKWMDPGTDANRSALIQKGFIPVVTHVTMQMQSDAIEPDNPVSSPGNGNGGNPVDPGVPPTQPGTGPEPSCPGGCDQPPTTPGGSVGECKPEVKADISADALFNFGQDSLTIGGQLELQKLIKSQAAETEPFDRMVVTGHSDPIGDKVYNDALSQRRADAVAQYLSQNGLRVKDVQVTGVGSSQPVVNPATCAGLSGTAEQNCYAKDRRVTIVLTPHN
jgi:outer membrane protein OmpA-like peptidoglycan-associated protein/uncharacterized membrane protein (UPF0127 family)/Flp pilus assembly protein TadG